MARLDGTAPLRDSERAGAGLGPALAADAPASMATANKDVRHKLGGTCI